MTRLEEIKFEILNNDNDGRLMAMIDKIARVQLALEKHAEIDHHRESFEDVTSNLYRSK